MTEGETYLAGMAVMHEYSDRGWFVAWPGEALQSPFQIRPMFNEFRLLARLGAYSELRSWIDIGAEREERFAKWFGFRLDCGPASGVGPLGQDMNLWLWRK